MCVPVSVLIKKHIVATFSSRSVILAACRRRVRTELQTCKRLRDSSKHPAFDLFHADSVRYVAGTEKSGGSNMPICWFHGTLVDATQILSHSSQRSLHSTIATNQHNIRLMLSRIDRLGHSRYRWVRGCTISVNC
jgi:hypothetical protein